jgi:hypothetical protein
MTEASRPTLLEVLNEEPGNRKRIIADCVVVLDSEVARKKGLSGGAIKLAFGTVKKVGRGILEDLIDMLFDEFVQELDPYYQSYLDADEATRPAFSRFLTDRADEVGNALLNVTDRRRQRASNRVLIKVYDKLRPSALKHVTEGVPAVGELMEKYALG